MDIKDFYKAGEVSRENGINMQKRERKEKIRNNIVAYYQDNFISQYQEMEVESAHFRNKEVIQEIANIFERDLETYFSKSPNCNKTKTVLAILVNKNVYVITTYRKTKPTFDLTGYIAECIPDSIRVIVDMLPSKNKKLKALIKYADASWDTDTVSQLQEMKDCKLI